MVRWLCNVWLFPPRTDTRTDTTSNLMGRRVYRSSWKVGFHWTGDVCSNSSEARNGTCQIIDPTGRRELSADYVWTPFDQGKDTWRTFAGVCIRASRSKSKSLWTLVLETLTATTDRRSYFWWGLSNSHIGYNRIWTWSDVLVAKLPVFE